MYWSPCLIRSAGNLIRYWSATCAPCVSLAECLHLVGQDRQIVEATTLVALGPSEDDDFYPMRCADSTPTRDPGCRLESLLVLGEVGLLGLADGLILAERPDGGLSGRSSAVVCPERFERLSLCFDGLALRDLASEDR